MPSMVFAGFGLIFRSLDIHKKTLPGPLISHQCLA